MNLRCFHVMLIAASLVIACGADVPLSISPTPRLTAPPTPTPTPSVDVNGTTVDIRWLGGPCNGTQPIPGLAEDAGGLLILLELDGGAKFDQRCHGNAITFHGVGLTLSEPVGPASVSLEIW